MRRTLRTFLLAAVGIVVACSAATEKKPATLCTPTKGSYCRCQDRASGEKVCAADGNSFGPCEPCESYGNPEGPLLPGDPGYDDDPFPEVDGGFEYPDDAGGAVCGDGRVQLGEDCDDENAVNDDGCSDTCKLSGNKAPSSSTCPGLLVDVWGNDHRPTLTSSTVGSGKRKTKSLCSASGSTATDGSGASDRVFRVTAHKNGTMVVAVTNPTFDAYLYVATECEAIATATKCINKENRIGDETLTFGVTQGSSYTVVVDGAADGEGDFKVTFSIQ